MKYYFFLFFSILSSTGKAQEWFGEVMLGAAAYNGDLTEKEFSVKRVQPSVSLNLKYNTGDFVNFRLGLGFAKLSGDDNDNRDPGLKSRNLSFKSNIYELNFCAEVNVFDPEVYYSYPYIFGGVGVFRFKPYTFDNDNRKTFLQPLGTEGQGLPDFPERKKYSLTQLCFPFGAGFKLKLNDQCEVSYEVGYRLLTTDYLDDVSKTYVGLKQLEITNGAKAAELSYRKDVPFMEAGEKRGNSKVNDSYFFTGIKLAIKIGERNY